MKKKKKDWLAITPPLFNCGSIEIHTNSKRLIKHMRASGAKVDDNYVEDIAGACIYSGLEPRGVLYVYVGDNLITTLVHECFHATVRYLAYVGVPVETNEPNETYAYMLDYLVGQGLPLIKS